MPDNDDNDDDDDNNDDDDDYDNVYSKKCFSWWDYKSLSSTRVVRGIFEAFVALHQDIKKVGLLAVKPVLNLTLTHNTGLIIEPPVNIYSIFY